MESTKKHFIFDLDDTLVDSHEFNQQIFVDTFEPYLDLANPEIEKYLRWVHRENKGASMHFQFKAIIDHFSLNADPQTLVKADEDMQIEKLHQIKAFEGVDLVVKSLRKSNKEVSLVSNRQSISLQKILERNGLHSHFTNVISCSDEGHEKPDPYCLNQIVEKSGLSKESFIYFGDSKTDYEFAKDAGIDCIIIDHYLNQKKFYKLLIESFL